MVVTPLVKVHTPDGKTVCKERDRKAYVCYSNSHSTNNRRPAKREQEVIKVFK